MKLKNILTGKAAGLFSSVVVLSVLAFSSCQKDTAVKPASVLQKTTQDATTTSGSATTQTSANTATQTTLPQTTVSNVSNAIVTYKTSQPISYTGVNNITISGLSITAGSVPAISLTNCINVHIKASRFVNGTTVTAVGVYLYNCTNVIIDSCYFNNLASGVVASTSTGIYIANNQMLNMQGPMPRGQFVQFISCYGAGNSIMSNKFENILGSSNPEDAINIFQSNGTSASPITIAYNWIRGGGPSKTGGGVALGDGGGSYQTAFENILVNPGQYGIAIAAGTVMSILNNKIYAAQTLFTNIGTFAWNQYPTTSGCSITTISGNAVNFTAAGGYQNSGWDGGNCGAISGWSTNTWGANITAAILPATIITMQ